MPYYNPTYEWIYKSDKNHKLTMEDIKKYKKDELEALYRIIGHCPHPIWRWLPFDKEDFSYEEVSLDYFLDSERDCSIELRKYHNHPDYKGYKQLNKEKGWFVKIDSFKDSITKEIVDIYIKIRKVKIKKGS